MAKISVIIPAYNAAKTIEKTVQNVLSSTIPLDVWVVDDGSTDGTGEILDRLNSSTIQPFNHSTLHVLHQANTGAYMARLNALKQITTPYFGFVDADDTIEPDMFEKLLAVAEAENCDVVQCAVSGIPPSVLGQWYLNLRNSNHHSTTTTPNYNLLPDRADVESKFIIPHLIKGQGASFIWNKLYRNQYDFSQFVTFERLTNFDDMIFNFQFFDKVNQMAFIEDELYHYAQTEGSTTHSYGPRQFEDLQSCRSFRVNRGISTWGWYLLNLRGSIVTVVRSDMSVLQKLTWLMRLGLSVFS